MTIFQLKQLASNSVYAARDAVGWHYDRAELIADGVARGTDLGPFDPIRLRALDPSLLRTS